MKQKKYTLNHRISKLERRLSQQEKVIEQLAIQIYYLLNNDKENTQMGESSDNTTEQ
jgi:uncharacterized coiled-coil protein SlyX